jgi:hypothetical protein
MNPHEKFLGKTLLHGNEAGEITPAMIKQRANELALIDGRARAGEEDRLLARKELQGEALPETTSDDTPAIACALGRDPSEPLSVPGRQIPNHHEADDDDTNERLAIEGIEEAQHDQMLAARRHKTL